MRFCAGKCEDISKCNVVHVYLELYSLENSITAKQIFPYLAELQKKARLEAS